jgi:hypothetical protein
MKAILSGITLFVLTSLGAVALAASLVNPINPTF